MYMVLAAQFRELSPPDHDHALAALSVPFAILSLILLHNPLDIYSIFGLFMLFGIVKKNGILQVDLHQLVARRRHGA